jgi:hypothetical protein
MVHAFLLMKDEVSIIEDWKYMGMKATSSYSFEVKGVKVAENRKFIIDQLYIVAPSPVYNFPFIHFAEATLAVNFSGMAIRFLDLYETITHKKEIPEATIKQLEEIKTSFHQSRDTFYEAINISWDECIKKNAGPDKLLEAVSDTSRAMAANARRLVSELYPYCGLSAADINTELNRLWRDFHTASQHPLLLYKY